LFEGAFFVSKRFKQIFLKLGSGKLWGNDENEKSTFSKFDFRDLSSSDLGIN
jgi:hypothetical protein